MKIEEVEKRFKNATSAALGSFGVCMMNCYRISQEVSYLPSSLKILRSSSLFAVAAGVVWFFMPRAFTDKEEDVKNETKVALNEPLNIFIKRVIESHKEQLEDIKLKNRPRTSSSSGSTSRYSWQSSNSSSTSVVVRGYMFDPWPLPSDEKDLHDDTPDEDEDEYSIEKIQRKMMEDVLNEDEWEDYLQRVENGEFDDELS